MGISFYVRFRHLFIVVVFVATIVVFQCYWKTFSLLNVSSQAQACQDLAWPGLFPTLIGNNVTFEKEEQGLDLDHVFDSDEGRNSRKGEIFSSSSSKSFEVENHENEILSFTQKTLHNYTQKVASDGSGIQSIEIVSQNGIPRLPKTSLPSLNNKSMTRSSTRMSKLVWPRLTTLTQLNSQLLQSYNYSSMRPKWSSRCDRELLSAKLEIENAKVISDSSGLYAPVYRQVSKFSRSYELMERKLKVYIYKEGEKPIFHQPKMRGLYASEGWFMKLMEGNKRFVVKDPKKAHLFYLPFSSQILRANLSDNKKMEQYLERYVNLIAGRYRFSAFLTV
ncbi:unnamed protein product [Trifolium pratense]|uniref:Uncharacterized protein n=1 Tax=Trifolium pratense TaxID=57577 RepID=A0ACB0IWU7_TRIPR|nr:unnamed protein product [Trifolium pratense]